MKYLALSIIAARTSTAYVGDLLGRSAFFLLMVFVLSRVFHKLLAGGEMAGFGTGDVVWYLILTEALLLSVPRFEQTVNEEIRTGSVAYLMVRPIHYIGHHLATYGGEVAVRLSMNLVIGGTFACLLAGPPPTPLWGLPGLGLAMFLGLLLHFHVMICLAMIGFWLEETRPFFWMYQKILFTAGGLMIPLEFFPDWLRQIVDRLPFASILYAPARLGVKFEWELAFSLISRQLFWVTLFALLAQVIYRSASARLQVNGG